MPLCPICGAALSFSFRPVIAGLIHLALCLLAMTFIPKPWAYFAAAPFAILALLWFGAGAFGLSQPAALTKPKARPNPHICSNFFWHGTV